MGVACAFRVCISLLGLPQQSPSGLLFCHSKNTFDFLWDLSLFGLQMAARLPPLYLAFLGAHTSCCLSVPKFPSLGEMPVILNEGPPIQPHLASVTTLQILSLNRVRFWSIGSLSNSVWFEVDTIHPVTEPSLRIHCQIPFVEFYFQPIFIDCLAYGR